MAAVIGGELIELDYIVPIGSDPHLYEPTPSDLGKVTNADLILINGLTFEGWLSKLIKSSGARSKSVLLTEGIIPIQNKEHQNATDPHAWMDVRNAKIYCQNIFRSLSEFDPLHKEEYKFNLDIYLRELDQLHEYITKEIDRIPKDQRILITSHDGFRYFGNAYGLTLEPLQGTSTEGDVQSATMIRINQLIRKSKIQSIFAESTINPKLIQQIRQENKIQIGGKLYADSLGDPKGESGSYIGMMKHNARTIVSGLLLESKMADTGSKNNAKFIYFGIGLFYLITLSLLYFINRK
ncbi:MAG: zinc ABC transporter substrate-binding protein [Saprospiraceae bacterium]|nr:zinc ABC transporter substrate-binding protein [Saprospiraceae bacterium]